MRPKERERDREREERETYGMRKKSKCPWGRAFFLLLSGSAEEILLCNGWKGAIKSALIYIYIYIYIYIVYIYKIDLD